MTGFGEASGESDGVHYAVELRSLNNRYFKALIRLPEEIAGLEAELESLLRGRIARGSVTLVVNLRDESASAAYEINQAALERYREQLRAMETEVDPAALLALPGVIQPPEQMDLLDRSRPVLRRLVVEACEKMTAMRETEGRGLADDLLAHSRYIAERVDQVAERAPLVVEEYHQRLRQRIDQLLAKAQLEVSQLDLIKEVAVYAERCDVSEEVQRVKAHLDQVEQILERSTSEPIGRTLDFLAQELLREANTIGSKSNDAQISRLIVEIKGAIDRIKEQVQNVE
jgi:uncharacterized protein (TIGR00255 family)